MSGGWEERRKGVSDREEFIAMLDHPASYNHADAAVVLCGEDIWGRMVAAKYLLQNQVVPKLILSGGRNDGHHTDAKSALGVLLGEAGVSPSKVELETESQNTHEQAVALVARAVEEEWNHVIVVASAYHHYRAFLTILRELQREGVADKVRLMSAPATQPWGWAPDGMDQTRLELLGEEFRKIATYPADHIASYADGLEYLLRWEPDKP